MKKIINVLQFFGDLSNEMLDNYFYYKFIQLVERVHKWMGKL